MRFYWENCIKPALLGMAVAILVAIGSLFPASQARMYFDIEAAKKKIQNLHGYYNELDQRHLSTQLLQAEVAEMRERLDRLENNHPEQPK